MKKILAVTTMMAISSVQAQNLNFGDLNYFLSKGEKNLSANAIVSSERARVADVRSEVEGYFFDTSFAYAFTDEFNAFVGLNYLYSVETDMNVSRKYDTDGLQNPKLGANYRLLKQANTGFNLDLGAVGSFKIMDREVGSNIPNKDGDLLNPAISTQTETRNTLELNGRLGKKWDEANEFYLTAALIYHTDGEYENASDKTDVDLDSSIDVKLKAEYQYSPLDEFMMTLGLSAIRYSDVDGDVEGVDFTFKNHIDYQLFFNAKYRITDRFIVKFAVSQDKRDDYDIKYKVIADQEVDKRSSFTYGAGIDFLF